MTSVRIPLKSVLLVAGCYSVFAALVSSWFTHVTGLSLWTLRPDLSANFSYILLMNLLLWGSWGLFAPAAFALARRFPLHRDTWRRSLVVHVAAALVITGAHILFVATARFGLQSAWGVAAVWDASVREAFFRTLDFELPVYWALIGLQHASDYYHQARARELAAAQLETRLIESQLQALQQQLRPHFLFNTLHAIAAFVQREPDKAEAMIERLSDLLRLTLQRVGDQEVTLREELDYLRAYLDIEQVHFGDRLEILYHVDVRLFDVAVPNLLLQPLAENAIRHGLEPRASRGRLAISASRLGDRLVLSIADNGCGLGEASARPAGVGLSNTQARLERLYRGAASLALSATAGGGVTATVTLPIRVMESNEHSSRHRRRSADGSRAAARAAV